jgi:Zn-finger nucleic acid-binding protein
MDEECEKARKSSSDDSIAARSESYCGPQEQQTQDLRQAEHIAARNDPVAARNDPVQVDKLPILTPILQVKREFVQEKSVATSETDKSKQVWLPKANSTKLMETFKNGSKKKKRLNKTKPQRNRHKTEQWGGQPPNPQPNH